MTKKQTVDPLESDPAFHLVAEDGAVLVQLTLGLTLYTAATLSQHSKAILAVYERFLGNCSADALTFYATENMRRHKPVSKTTLTMLPTWLKPGAPKRELIRLQLKDGAQYQDAPRHKFDVFGIEPKSKLFGKGSANLVSLAFPADGSADVASKMRELFVEMCTSFPFQSGHAGFSFECSRYADETSQTHAWRASMRHRGIDISRIVDDALAVGTDAVKGAGWLTALNDEVVSQLGGSAKLRKALSREIEIIQIPKGVVLQAGPVPLLGDVNKRDVLPLYRSVFALIAPLVRTAAERSPSLNLATDYVERTENWFMRLGDG